MGSARMQHGRPLPAAPATQSLAPTFFAASLFPYLAFLYFLHASGKTPKTTLVGFYFLLAFVGATIPAGIYGEAQLLCTYGPYTIAYGAMKGPCARAPAPQRPSSSQAAAAKGRGTQQSALHAHARGLCVRARVRSQGALRDEPCQCGLAARRGRVAAHHHQPAHRWVMTACSQHVPASAHAGAQRGRVALGRAASIALRAPLLVLMLVLVPLLLLLLARSAWAAQGHPGGGGHRGQREAGAAGGAGGGQVMLARACTAGLGCGGSCGGGDVLWSV